MSHITIAEERRRWRELADIRAAIRGWAFAADDAVQFYIKVADGRKRLLPPDLQPFAEELIAPLREHLAKLNKKV